VAAREDDFDRIKEAKLGLSLLERFQENWANLLRLDQAAPYAPSRCQHMGSR
jgi:hypothetical protein